MARCKQRVQVKAQVGGSAGESTVNKESTTLPVSDLAGQPGETLVLNLASIHANLSSRLPTQHSLNTMLSVP